MDLQEAMRQRKSVKKFSHKKPDWRKILRAIDVVRFAPRAGGQFSMKWMLVSDEEVIRRIAPWTYQEFVAEAPFLVVAVSDEQKVVRSYGSRGQKYSLQQAGAAIQNFLLAATEQDLSTCWVGYFDDEHIKEILEIPRESVIEALFPVGLGVARKTEVSRKVSLDSFLYFDTWKNKTMTPKAKVKWEGI